MKMNSLDRVKTLAGITLSENSGDPVEIPFGDMFTLFRSLDALSEFGGLTHSDNDEMMVNDIVSRASGSSVSSFDEASWSIKDGKLYLSVVDIDTYDNGEPGNISGITVVIGPEGIEYE